MPRITAATGTPEFNMNSPEGKLLDSLFCTAGVEGGMGALDPYNFSPAAIKMLYPEFGKFGDSQFRKAAERAANREIKRLRTTQEPPAPNAGGANYAPGPMAGVRATMATPSPTPSATNQTVAPPPAATHNWDMITDNYETLDAEYYFITGQLPWATQKGQINVHVSDDGLTVVVQKKASRKSMNPKAILNAMFGAGVHGDNDVHTVALNLAIKDKHIQSADKTAYVSVQEHPVQWEVERQLNKYLIQKIPVEAGKFEVWVYIRVKRLGNTAVPAMETPEVPYHRSGLPTPTGGGGSAESPAVAAPAPAPSPAADGTPMDTSDRTKRSRKSAGVRFSTGSSAHTSTKSNEYADRMRTGRATRSVPYHSGKDGSMGAPAASVMTSLRAAEAAGYTTKSATTKSAPTDMTGLMGSVGNQAITGDQMKQILAAQQAQFQQQMQQQQQQLFAQFQQFTVSVGAATPGSIPRLPAGFGRGPAQLKNGDNDGDL